MTHSVPVTDQSFGTCCEPRTQRAGEEEPSGRLYVPKKDPIIESTSKRTSDTLAPTSQEFFLLGDNGYRDSVGTTMAGEMACTTFFINSLSSGAPQADIDTALGLVMAAESDPDKELFVEMLTLLGQDASNNFLYFVRAFQACVTGVSEAAPSDGLIEYSWTFQSRGEIYVGTLNNSTSALDVYA